MNMNAKSMSSDRSSAEAENIVMKLTSNHEENSKSVFRNGNNFIKIKLEDLPEISIMFLIFSFEAEPFC